MNRVQSGWLGVPYIGSPVGSVWLGTQQMRDLGGSWTRIISMLFLLFSNIVFIRVLFFLTFCENIFRVFLIIVSYCLQLGKLNWPWFPGLPVLFLSASPYWINFSRKGICSCQPCVRLCNWCIWRNEGKAGLVQFWVKGFNLGLALQHYANSLWCSSLCGLLHFWHREPWALYEKVEWPHFQQLWH